LSLYEKDEGKIQYITEFKTRENSTNTIDDADNYNYSNEETKNSEDDTINVPAVILVKERLNVVESTLKKNKLTPIIPPSATSGIPKESPAERLKRLTRQKLNAASQHDRVEAEKRDYRSTRRRTPSPNQKNRSRSRSKSPQRSNN